MTIVIDGSAAVVAVFDTGNRGAVALSHLHNGAIAPHLVDAEIGQAFRGMLLRKVLTLELAEELIDLAGKLVTRRFVHSPLLKRAWALRDNVSFYDGLYVALAEANGVPLLTADAKLAKARGPRCKIVLV